MALSLPGCNQNFLERQGFVELPSNLDMSLHDHLDGIHLPVEHLEQVLGGGGHSHVRGDGGGADAFDHSALRCSVCCLNKGRYYILHLHNIKCWDFENS